MMTDRGYLRHSGCAFLFCSEWRGAVLPYRSSMPQIKRESECSLGVALFPRLCVESAGICFPVSGEGTGLVSDQFFRSEARGQPDNRFSLRKNGGVRLAGTLKSMNIRRGGRVASTRCLSRISCAWRMRASSTRTNAPFSRPRVTFR